MKKEKKKGFDLGKTYKYELNNKYLCYCNIFSFYIDGTNDAANIQVNLIERQPPYSDTHLAYLQLKWNSRSCIITKQERECLEYIEKTIPSSISRIKIYDIEEIITDLNYIRILVKSFSEIKRIQREKYNKTIHTHYL